MHYYTAMEIIAYTRKGPALPVKFQKHKIKLKTFKTHFFNFYHS